MNVNGFCAVQIYKKSIYPFIYVYYKAQVRELNELMKNTQNADDDPGAAAGD